MNKMIRPMLIGAQRPPFDDVDFLYEIKLDGIRCIACCDRDGVTLYNKRGMRLLAHFPELGEIHRQAKRACILDGELYVFKEGVTDFFAVQKRALLRDDFKIRIAAKQYPATFTAFDVLEIEGNSLMQTPLIERKNMLEVLIEENERLNISRYIEEQGMRLFELTKEKGLEGIVAKEKSSLYYEGKRTKEWIKCKHLLDDDFVIAGYIRKSQGMTSLVLGKYDEARLVYKGHVTLGVSLTEINRRTQKTKQCPFREVPLSNADAIWIQPFLVGTVTFMQYTREGNMRQPVFKGLRDDKLPMECCV